MAYNTDGSSHRTGVKEEENICNEIKSNSLYKNKVCPSIGEDYSVEQKGGTKYKEDIVVTDNRTGNEILISIKKKKNLEKGSFDYVNSSSAIKNDPVFDKIRKIATSIKTNKPSKSSARRRFNEVSNQTMRKMSSKSIKKILVENVCKPNKDKRMLVRDKSCNIDYVYNFVDDPLYTAIMTMEPSFKWGRGKTSAPIIFKDEAGNEYHFGLRGRLVSNNGISAMIGKSKTNKTSYPVIKIQQDNAGSIIGRIPKNKITIIKTQE